MQPKEEEQDSLKKLVEGLKNESERGAAVLAASYIENGLGLGLKRKMTVPDLEDEIFGSNGPLSTFSQRINFCEAFGFLSPTLCKELRLIKDIRNYFSHHPFEASFSKDPVRGKVSSFQMYSGMKSKLKDESDFGLKDLYLAECGLVILKVNADLKNS